MEQFRPATAIAADRTLVESFRAGDDAAIRSMVRRFGPQVVSLLTAHGASASAVEVFVQAWVESDEFDAGDDIGPWLRSIAVALVGPQESAESARADDDRWQVSGATASFDADAHGALRAHHVDGHELAAGSERHELRLRRRMAHVGSDADIDRALADPLVWERPDRELADRVIERIAAESESVASPPDPEASSWLSRSVRPVLLGLGAAVFVLFVAIVGLSAAGGEVDEPEFTVALTPTGSILDVEAGELTVTVTDSGLRLDIDAFTLPRRSGGQVYLALLVLDDDQQVIVGSFNEGFGVRLTAGVDLEQAAEVRIVATDLAGDFVDTDTVLKADLPRR